MSLNLPQPSRHKESAGPQIQRAQTTWGTIIIIIANTTTKIEALFFLPRLLVLLYIFFLEFYKKRICQKEEVNFDSLTRRSFFIYHWHKETIHSYINDDAISLKNFSLFIFKQPLLCSG